MSIATDDQKFLKIVETVRRKVDEADVEGAMRECLRLARLGGDVINTAIFSMELHGKSAEVARVVCDDAPGINKEDTKFIIDTAIKRYLQIHKAEGKGDSVWAVNAGMIEFQISSITEAVRSIDGFMEGRPINRSYQNYVNQKIGLIEQKRGIQKLKHKMLMLCYNFAIYVEKRTIITSQSNNFLHSAQSEVLGYFRENSPKTFAMLQKASELIGSNDTEAANLILTEVRRALKSAADHFYPALESEVMCADGRLRFLKDDQYLNRLREYVARSSARSSAKLLKAELGAIDEILAGINGISSKGVHATASLAEAKHGLLALYSFLHTLIINKI